MPLPKPAAKKNFGIMRGKSTLPSGYDQELEEEDMPNVVQVETLYNKEVESVYNSRGQLRTFPDATPKCSDLNIELQKHQNDPKTGIPTLMTFHEKVMLPFRTDDNAFTRHHGFTARDVTRFVWHMPGKDKAFRCVTITAEQIAAERKAKRDARAGVFVAPPTVDDSEMLGVLDDGSQGYSASMGYSASIGVGQGANPAL